MKSFYPLENQRGDKGEFHKIKPIQPGFNVLRNYASNFDIQYKCK